MKVKLKFLTALKIWIVIYPALTLFLYIFNEELSVLPIYIRTLLLTISLVPLIVFAGIPFVDKIIRYFAVRTNNRMDAK